MLGSSWVAAQLPAPQEGLSSMSEWVSEWVKESRLKTKKYVVTKGLGSFPNIDYVNKWEISLRVHYLQLEYLRSYGPYATTQNMRYLSYETQVHAEWNAWWTLRLQSNTRIEWIEFDAHVGLLLDVLSLRLDTMTHPLSLSRFVFISRNTLDLSWRLCVAFPSRLLMSIHLPWPPILNSLIQWSQQ
jgi:hypothetical protein